MQVSVITLFPEMFDALSDAGISGRAIKQGLLSLATVNPRDFTEDRHHSVDDRPYGGGPGMVMTVGPLSQAIDSAKTNMNVPGKPSPKVVYMSPQGKRLDQQVINVELKGVW